MKIFLIFLSLFMLVNLHDQGESFVHEDFLSKVVPERILVLNTIKNCGTTQLQKLKIRSKFLDFENQKVKVKFVSKTLQKYNGIFFPLIEFKWGPQSLATPPPSKLVS